MNHPNGVWSRNPPGHGHSSSRSIYSVDNRPGANVRVDVVTPAQAYASVMRTGQRTLYHTIERRQPEEKGKVPEPQFGPPQLGNYGDLESSTRGLSYAQRLYASALSNKNSTLPSNNIPVIPIGHASSSALLTDGSHGIPPRKPDTSLEDVRSFNPYDLYHGHVAAQGSLSRGSTLPEASSTRHSSLNTLPATRPSYSSISRASGSSSQNTIPKSAARNPRQVPHSFQSVSMEAQPSRSAALNARASGPPEAPASTHQDFHMPPMGGETTPSLSPLLQQFLNLPPPSSPRHRALSGLPQEFVADVAPVITRLPASVSHEGGRPEHSFHPPSEVHHEEVPSYSLVDEQLPPPAFDDLHIGINNT